MNTGQKTKSGKISKKAEQKFESLTLREKQDVKEIQGMLTYSNKVDQNAKSTQWENWKRCQKNCTLICERGLTEEIHDSLQFCTFSLSQITYEFNEKLSCSNCRESTEVLKTLNKKTTAYSSSAYYSCS